MDLATYTRTTDPLYAEMDQCAARMAELAELIDTAVYKAHVEGKNRVNDIAAVHDIVPRTIYNRLERYRKKHGDERERPDEQDGRDEPIWGD